MSFEAFPYEPTPTSPPISLEEYTDLSGFKILPTDLEVGGEVVLRQRDLSDTTADTSDEFATDRLIGLGEVFSPNHAYTVINYVLIPGVGSQILELNTEGLVVSQAGKGELGYLLPTHFSEKLQPYIKQRRDAHEREQLQISLETQRQTLKYLL